MHVSDVDLLKSTIQAAKNGGINDQGAWDEDGRSVCGHEGGDDDAYIHMHIHIYINKYTWY